MHKQFYSKPYHATHRHKVFSTIYTHYLLWDFNKKNHCPDTLFVILYTIMKFTSIHIQLYLPLRNQMQYRYNTAWCQKWFFLLLHYQKLTALKMFKMKEAEDLNKLYTLYSTQYFDCEEYYIFIWILFKVRIILNKH